MERAKHIEIVTRAAKKSGCESIPATSIVMATQLARRVIFYKTISLAHVFFCILYPER